MITTKNIFGEDSSLRRKEISDERIGQKIHEIRKFRGLTQKELGEKVGLSADRIRKYENGYRTPKNQMLDNLADALDVPKEALRKPDVSTPEGCMQAFFQMQRDYNLKIERDENNCIKLYFEDGRKGTMNAYLNDWVKKYSVYEKKMEELQTDKAKKLVQDDYDEWIYTYPESIYSNKKMREQRKKNEDRINQEIAELERLKNFDN